MLAPNIQQRTISQKEFYHLNRKARETIRRKGSLVVGMPFQRFYNDGSTYYAMRAYQGTVPILSEFGAVALRHGQDKHDKKLYVVHMEELDEKYLLEPVKKPLLTIDKRGGLDVSGVILPDARHIAAANVLLDTITTLPDFSDDYESLVTMPHRIKWASDASMEQGKVYNLRESIPPELTRAN